MFEGISNICAFGALYGPAFNKACEAFSGTFGPTTVVQNYGPTTSLPTILPGLYERVEGLREDILVYVTNQAGIKAIGSAYSPHSLILIDQEFNTTLAFQNSFYFLAKHEVSHILNSDHLKSCIISGAASLIAALAVRVIKPYVKESFVPALYLLPSLTSTLATILQHKSMEIEADRFAIEMSTDDELQGGLFFFSTFLEANIQLHASRPDLTTAEGNFTFSADQIHPLHTTRIERILIELARRGVAPQYGTQEDRQIAITHHQSAVRRMFNLPQVNVNNEG